QVRSDMRRRLLEFARRDVTAMDLPSLREYIAELRQIFSKGSMQHFFQQPASMVPVGDWVRRVSNWTGAATSEIVSGLRGPSAESGNYLTAIEELADDVRSIPEEVQSVLKLAEEPSLHPDQLDSISPRFSEHLRLYLDEYGDRIITGFDITDVTLR